MDILNNKIVAVTPSNASRLIFRGENIVPIEMAVSS